MAQRPDLRDFVGMSEDTGFARYLDLIAERDHVQWTPQYEFLFDETGTLLVDFLGRFESLHDDAATIFQRCGLGPADLPHINASNRSKPYRDFYTDQTRRRVGRLYARDIDQFGYRF